MTAPRPLSKIRLLLVDDDDDLRQTLAKQFRHRGAAVTEAASGPEALSMSKSQSWDVAVLDLHMPEMSGLELLAELNAVQPQLEALMLTAAGTIETAIEAMRNGAYDYLTKPFPFADLEIRVGKAWEKVQLARRERQWVERLRYESERYQLIGSSEAMQKVIRLIQKVAPTDATVLVRGPSGTGKELVSRAVHFNSERRDRPLVTINCAALQETLLESELFGHEKGAFTGATVAKAGLVEVAEGGTLFIDEVAEMAPGLQAKLLRLLEDGHYRRVGGTKESCADVRVVAATNKPLEENIKEGHFREDLFFRLNVFAIDLPPLSARRADIPELIDHLLRTRPLTGMPWKLSPEALAALRSYEWPGNVRELANVLERAQILAEGDGITLDDLPDQIVEGREGHDIDTDSTKLLSAAERRHVLGILEEEKWNKVRAAQTLGISRRALYRLIEKHALENKAN